MAPRTSGTLKDYRAKRDFRRTAEPSGEGTSKRHKRGDGLAFVIQKHDASHLHFDLRLEVDGVMKSWAVPKGPSLDPSVRRLAVQVEDHPMDYNDFEGTIPEGEYGGGTVLLWDRGTYTADDAADGKDEARMRKDLRSGKISISFRGERLRGSFALVRMKKEEGRKPQWLLMKHDDETADVSLDIVEREVTSVASGRTMEEIAAGKGRKRTWRSNRKSKSAPSTGGATVDLGAVSPMLASTSANLPTSGDWTYEPKYDGIRVLAFATEGSVALVSRNANDKAKQFPEITAALRELVAKLERPVILDGEIVALANGDIARFERLQGRMHVQGRDAISAGAQKAPAVFMAFDILADGDITHVHDPWTARRVRLEEVLESNENATLRITETTRNGEALLRRGKQINWEGIIAKRTDSRYLPGKRSGDWLKIKLEASQEFVVGGYTEPRRSRKYFGALLLGYYDDDGMLVYAGHTGGGFNRDSLADMYSRMKRIERKTSPFKPAPRTNETAHWVTPKIVVEIKFNEWTKDGKLRQPIFLGIRDDKDPTEVIREPPGSSTNESEVQDSNDDSVIKITNPDKVFFPAPGRYTKGQVAEYYRDMGAVILPAMHDRPLVLKRYPNGINGKSFYQQSAPDNVPEGVRVEILRSEDGQDQRRFVGGNLPTLLYTIQLGAISYDPWHSRVGALEVADYTVIDLDPGPEAPFRTVVEVARRVREEMDAVGLNGAVKTSGSSGLHIFLPLPPHTPLDAATLVAQILATRVAEHHPTIATVERMRRNRPPKAVYVDFLQNILGKTVAGVYAVRAKKGATVSTPLEWTELTDDLDLRDFTIETVPSRVARVGDLWGAAMGQENDLGKLLGT
ncbi:MAG TPA: DNA ligase D [Longimicrobiaceae bacterium]|nr:DNA ligase D [Longimicrobiaceae bacterium]